MLGRILIKNTLREINKGRIECCGMKKIIDGLFIISQLKAISRHRLQDDAKVGHDITHAAVCFFFIPYSNWF